ncbi:hypothetical protein Cantr_06960 [Candida viswanathii]|uniref:Vacuolar membrane protein n=1 Tax=Candida viswanathii TaxID=5486 RepID=A0A367XVI2_9ASCO|nr:hypothetical protein Cantr_06960 [Candida viswanathii]
MTIHQPTPTLLHPRDNDNGNDNVSADLPTLSTTSVPSLSITHIPTQNNPYVNVSSLPTNLVFIIVGAILGAIFVLIVTYRIVTHVRSGRQAHREKETYYSNLDDVLNAQGLVYGYAYSRTSSALDLNSVSGGSPTSSSSNQGRSYRITSMFISPTMDLKNFDLPLYRKQHSSSLASLLMKYHDNGSSTFFDEKSRTIFDVNDSLVNSAVSTVNGVGSGSTVNGSTVNGSTVNGSSIVDTKYSMPQKSPLRAPSLVLDDLLNEEMKRSLSEKTYRRRRKREVTMKRNSSFIDVYTYNRSRFLRFWSQSGPNSRPQKLVRN